jgi:hypothetical protein
MEEALVMWLAERRVFPLLDGFRTTSHIPTNKGPEKISNQIISSNDWCRNVVSCMRVILSS